MGNFDFLVSSDLVIFKLGFSSLREERKKKFPLKQVVILDLSFLTF